MSGFEAHFVGSLKSCSIELGGKALSNVVSVRWGMSSGLFDESESYIATSLFGEDISKMPCIRIDAGICFVEVHNRTCARSIRKLQWCLVSRGNLSERARSKTDTVEH